MITCHNIKRRTGRTTRMLAEAVRLSREGRAVYIMVHGVDYGEMLNRDLPVEPGEIHGIKFETPASLPNFNWRTMRLTGAHPNCVVLVDHHAIESVWSGILNEWMRYDQEDEP